MTSNLYLSPICSCIICHKEFSKKGINSHFIAAHTKEGNNKVKTSFLIGCKIASNNRTKKAKENYEIKSSEYNLNPSKCFCCDTVLTYNKRNNKFCSHSCASKISNKERIEKGYVISDEIKLKISLTLKTKPKKKIIKIKKFKCRKCKTLHETKDSSKQCCSKQHNIKQKKINSDGPYSKLRLCTCKICKLLFCSKTQLQFCSKCRDYHSNIKSQFRFTFNVYHFPELFDLNLLKEIGFYSPGGKAGKWNINGLSRDHKVSVADAIKFNYNPYYITHPMNCELMLHRDNDKKKSKSSISYETLVQLVKEYESKNMV